MDVQCYECSKNMGTIRDAKLRKGWGILCSQCLNIPNDSNSNTITAESKEDFQRQMKDMFGFDVNNPNKPF